MKSIITILFVVVFGGASEVLHASWAAESPDVRFQAILDAAVKDGMVAVSASVSWDNGSWEGVAGETSADSGAELNPDSLFRLASVTKLFTATVILELVDEQALRLSDTLDKHLSENLAAKIPYADSITVNMLLDHTSGIRSFSDIDSFWREAYGNGGLDRTWDPDNLIEYGLRKKPYFKPGSRGKRHYSNSNYIFLGMIIEKITKGSLAEAYRRRIYEPLGMNNTILEGFDERMNMIDHSFIKAGVRADIVAKKRGWHDANQNGFYDSSGNYTLYNGWAWSAGGISSTTGDLRRFLIGVRDGSLLSTKSQSVLFRSNSAEGNAGIVFGGSGGWEGITTSAYEINNEIRIIVLANTTGLAVDANTLRSQLFRVLRPSE